MFAAIFRPAEAGGVLTTGSQWKALPRCLGAGSTVHDRFQQWARACVFEALWTTGLMEFDASVGLDWTWQSIDGCMTKAPLGGDATGPNPTHRGKQGTKRHLLTEGHGLPIGLVATGANRNDLTQAEAVLDARAVVSFEAEPHRAGVHPPMRQQGLRLEPRPLGASGFVAHILSRGQEKVALEMPGYRARRWVVEAAHSWLNRFRRLLVRWEKKGENYLTMLHVACAVIVWRRCPLTTDDYLSG